MKEREREREREGGRKIAGAPSGRPPTEGNELASSRAPRPTFQPRWKVKPPLSLFLPTWIVIYARLRMFLRVYYGTIDTLYAVCTRNPINRFEIERSPTSGKKYTLPFVRQKPIKFFRTTDGTRLPERIKGYSPAKTRPNRFSLSCGAPR